MSIEYQLARTTWASHILGNVLRQVSQSSLAPPDDDLLESEDDIPVDDLDARSTKIAILTNSPQKAGEKFLDCLAELMSPEHGWGAVVATSLWVGEHSTTHVLVAVNARFEKTTHNWEEIGDAIRESLMAQASSGKVFSVFYAVLRQTK